MSSSVGTLDSIKSLYTIKKLIHRYRSGEIYRDGGNINLAAW